MAESWVFTLFNYTDADLDRIQYIAKHSPGLINYLFYGYEETKTGKEHLQGYIQFTEKVRFDFLKRNLFKIKHIHLDRARSSVMHNYRYCKKELHVYIGVWDAEITDTHELPDICTRRNTPCAVCLSRSSQDRQCDDILEKTLPEI